MAAVALLLGGLTTASLAPLTPASAAPVAPAPLGIQSGTVDDDVIDGVDVHDGVVTAVGRTAPPGPGATEAFVLTVRPGEPPARTAIARDVMDDAAAVDAGSWGSVVVGSSVDPESAAWELTAQRYDPSGEVLWTTTLDQGASDLPSDVVVADGTVYVAGDSQAPGEGRGFLVATLDLETGVEQQRRVWGRGPWSSATRIAVDGDLLVVGGFAQHAAEGPHLGFSDAVVVGLDRATLATRWATQFGTAGQDLVGGVAVAGEAVYVASRRAREPVGMVMSRLRRDGTPVWNRAKPVGDGLAEPLDLVADARGPVAVGLVEGRLDATTGPFETVDAFAQAFDAATGAVRWTSRTGDAATSESYRAAALSGDRVIAAGATDGDLFAPSAGGRDAIVAVVAPPPAPPVVRRAVRATVRPTSLRVRAGASGSATIAITNAGSASDAVRARLACRPGAGVRLVATQGGRDVTAALLRGTYATPTLAAGRSSSLRLRVTAARDARARRLSCSVRATSAGAPATSATATLRLRILRRR